MVVRSGFFPWPNTTVSQGTPRLLPVSVIVQLTLLTAPFSVLIWLTVTPVTMLIPSSRSRSTQPVLICSLPRPQSDSKVTSRQIRFRARAASTDVSSLPATTALVPSSTGRLPWFISCMRRTIS